MMGVEMTREAFMISLMRGTPSVTFMLATPAKWNVLSVICVAGSPMECAATAPTASPGWMRARWYLDSAERRDAMSAERGKRAVWCTTAAATADSSAPAAHALTCGKGAVSRVASKGTHAEDTRETRVRAEEAGAGAGSLPAPAPAAAPASPSSGATMPTAAALLAMCPATSAA